MSSSTSSSFRHQQHHRPLAQSSARALARPISTTTSSGSKRRRADGAWPRAAAPLPFPPPPMRAAAAALAAAIGAARAVGPIPLPLRPLTSVAAASASSPSPATDGAAATTTPTPITLVAAGERGTRALARLLASERRAGDCYFLRGRVGAGKSAFSRAFVRAAAGDPYLPVPSPTFLLLNTYEVGEGEGEEDEGAAGRSGNADPAPIHHFDLYRLDPAKTSPAELVRLDIPGALASGVALVEWPERLVAIAEAAAGSAIASTSTTPLSSSLVPQSRVDVYVDPLADDDPARAELAEALRVGGESGSGGGRGRLRAAPLSAGEGFEDDDEDEDEEEEDDEDDGSLYADRRWRRWTLVPTSDEWEVRLRARLKRAAEEAAAAARRDGDRSSSDRGLFLIE